MRSLLAVVGVLILIAAITPATSAWTIDLPGDYRPANECTEGVITVFNQTNVTWSGNTTTVWHGDCTGSVRSGSSPEHFGASGTYKLTYNPTAELTFLCDDGGNGCYNYFIYNKTLPSPPQANFTATPTQGSGPVYVSFTDTSTGPLINQWNWSVTPLSGWSVNPFDLDNEDITIQFVTNGNYTVSHSVGSPYGNDTETKTDYIWIFNSTSTVTTPFTAIDLAFAHPITGANISLYDIGNSSWTNGTTGSDGKVSITTLQGHYINGYATAAGYDDADLLGVDAYAGGHTFYMYPQGYTNVSEWNVTVFINVVDDSDFGVPLTGVTVTGMYGSTSQTQTSDSAGIARFVFPNSTDIHFGATKAGYAGTTITLNTGVPSGGSAAITGTIHMFKGAITTAPTPTTLPGGGTPTVTITVDPYPCVGDGSYQDTLNCQRKQGEMGADLIAYGPDLVKFFIMLTFVGGLALMGKGFK